MILAVMKYMFINIIFSQKNFISGLKKLTPQETSKDSPYFESFWGRFFWHEGRPTICYKRYN